MIRVEAARDQVNVAKIYEAGQGHIFDYWDELNAAGQAELLAQLERFDAAELARIINQLVIDPETEAHERLDDLKPAPMIALPSSPVQSQERARAVAAGSQALKRGEVGVFLVAGGMGTRLAFEGPKGMYPVGPVSERSLFELFAHKILALGRRLKRPLAWFIMTSDANHETTREFFKKHSFFGLHPSDIYFERQGMLPVVDRRGKILMQSPSSVVMSPDGHGATVRVVRRLQGILDQRGIKYLFYHQVDNPLVRICDPAFIGFHLLRDSEFSSKAVPREDADERVGVFCQSGERVRVIEYTELGKHERSVRDEDGRLTFRAGNIANHVLSTAFLCPRPGEPAFAMEYHVAHKATTHFKDGEQVTSDTPNSIKFESFLFDALPHARNPIVLTGSRRKEFAPLKNLTGVDSAETSRRALIEEYGRWLEGAGVEVPRDEQGLVIGSIEIDPLFAASARELKERLEDKPVTFQDPMVLQ